MTKEIEKKSKTKFMLKLLAVAAIAGAVWKVALEFLGGNDTRWEN